MGHKVTVLILERDLTLKKNISKIGVKLINYPLSANIYEGFSFSPLAIPRILFSNYDIIHVHNCANWGSLLSALRQYIRGTPVVVTPHTALKDYPKLIRYIYNTLASFVLRSASGVLLLSTFQRDYLIKNGLLPPEKPTVIVHNLVGEAFFAISRVARPVSHGIYVGRIETFQKALDRLLPVFDALKGSGLRFTLVGDGPFRQTLANRIQEENWKHVELPGWIPNEQLPEFLSKADFFIMPTRYETQPIALLEAMAAGLPIVGSEIPGITEFCPREAGLFISEPDNPQKWVNAILKLVDNPDMAHRMGIKARKAAEAHHPDKVAAEHLKIYRKFSKGVAGE